MKSLKIFILLGLILSGYVQAIVNGSTVSAEDWRSVVLIELYDSKNKILKTCTAVIISDQYAVTTAGCLLNEKTGKQLAKPKLCIGQKRPFKDNNEACIETDKIYSNYNYINNTTNATAYNLAYVKFKNALDLNKFNIKPATLITPAEFTKIVAHPVFPQITWVAFDGLELGKPVQGVKQQGMVSGAEFDYQSLAISIDSTVTRPGSNYQGMASFIQNEAGEWRLLGLVSLSTPDNLLSYYPEPNPCDEDPIPVHYPKPIIRVSTLISVYPVAACSMTNFFAAEGFDELSCKKLLAKGLDWDLAIENKQPIALRQSAMELYRNSHSMNDAGDIYKLLYQAHQAGDSKATILLANFLAEGKLFAKDIETAQHLINELLASKDPSASLLQAKIILFPDNNTALEPSTDETDMKILALLETAANAGYKEAQYLLARLYQLGIGATKNHKKAYQWYAMAAMQGHADGQYQLGMQWTDGRGVRAFPEVAEFWIRQAAGQGQLEAQNRLGLLKPVVNQ